MAPLKSRCLLPALMLALLAQIVAIGWYYWHLVQPVQVAPVTEPVHGNKGSENQSTATLYVHVDIADKSQAEHTSDSRPDNPPHVRLVPATPMPEIADAEWRNPELAMQAPAIAPLPVLPGLASAEPQP